MCSSDHQALAELWASNLFRMKDSNIGLAQRLLAEHTAFLPPLNPYASYSELLKILLKYMKSVSHWSPRSLLPTNHSKAGIPELHNVCQASISRVRAGYKGRNAPIQWEWTILSYICIYSNYLYQIRSLKWKRTHFCHWKTSCVFVYTIINHTTYSGLRKALL